MGKAVTVEAEHGHCFCNAVAASWQIALARDATAELMKITFPRRFYPLEVRL